MLIFPSEYSARAPETQCLKTSTPTFFHLYWDTHLSTTMVYTVACDKASPRSPCFPSHFMAHSSRVIHDNSNKKLKMPIKLAQPPSPSFFQNHSKHRSFMGWQHPPYCDCFLCLIWVIASSSSTSSSKITFYSWSITRIQAWHLSCSLWLLWLSQASWEPGVHLCHSPLHPQCLEQTLMECAPKHLFGKKGEERLFLTMSFPIIFKKSGQWFTAITEAWFLTRHSLRCLQVLGDPHVQEEMGQKHHLFAQMFVHVGFLCEINHQSYVFCKIIMQ